MSRRSAAPTRSSKSSPQQFFANAPSSSVLFVKRHQLQCTVHFSSCRGLGEKTRTRGEGERTVATAEIACCCSHLVTRHSLSLVNRPGQSATDFRLCRVGGGERDVIAPSPLLSLFLRRSSYFPFVHCRCISLVRFFFFLSFVSFLFLLFPKVSVDLSHVVGSTKTLGLHWREMRKQVRLFPHRQDSPSVR